MSGGSKERRAAADLKVQATERREAAQQHALAEYEAESERRRNKSAKLKELRLAKEAVDLAAANIPGLRKKARPGRP